MRFWRALAGVLVLLAGLACTGAGTLAQFRTVWGDIDVELYDHDKPITVQNFISYVQSGRYADGIAHRVVPGFVVQGGGIFITNRGTTNWNFAAVPTFGPITNEFGVGTRYSNVYGTIAMAKLGGDTNSATSQWYFNLANNTSLDAANTNSLFVVFGHTLRGTNILNLMGKFKAWSGLTAPPQSTNLDLHAYFYPPLDDLPLLYPSLQSDTNLLFIDISLLSVQVTNVSNQRQISWTSVTGKTNVVEYTTVMPPSWQTLVSTNGNGSPFLVVDPTPTNAFRFYRVRVLY
jgi:cyclophilin family peptidyl-prolyl cis-trans isomerase